MPDDTPTIGQSSDLTLQRRLQALPRELLLAIISWLTLSPTIDILCVSSAIYNKSIPHLYLHPPRLDQDNVEAFYGHILCLRHGRHVDHYWNEYFHRQVVVTYDVELDDYFRLPPFLSKLFLLQHVRMLSIYDAVALARTNEVIAQYRAYRTYVYRCTLKTPRIKERLEAPLFQEVNDIVTDIGDHRSGGLARNWLSLLRADDVFPKLKNVTLYLPSKFTSPDLVYKSMVKTLRACHLQKLSIHGLPPDSCATFSKDLYDAAKVTECHPY
ncbi:hypothetical protein B9479_008009 [Cryptococcus floricola]|uniref:F-box domain-containing protein n=1 Tax=Cryptococcus floricola TaxID=2591691 RepID=A0A5D3AKV0_9TREE|nr:hypothetical protein B9479_008009 [Cryptococcus floricola]